MATTKEIINSVITIILVVCAIIIGGLSIHQEFFSKENIFSGLRYVNDWENISIDTHQEGTENATVKIFKFYDYQCPFCKDLDYVLKQLSKKYSDDIKIQYIHYPLSIHQYAYKAAIVAECSRSENQFMQIHDFLFEYQAEISLISMEDIADDFELSQKEKFLSCVENEFTSNVVNESIALSEELNITRIPTMVINGWVIEGAAPLEYLDQLVNNLIEN